MPTFRSLPDYIHCADAYKTNVVYVISFNAQWVTQQNATVEWFAFLSAACHMPHSSTPLDSIILLILLRRKYLVCNRNKRENTPHFWQQCHNSKFVIFQEKLLKVLKCYNFLWVQRRHNCSPAASFCKLHYDTIPVKSASANVSFYTNNSKLQNFEFVTLLSHMSDMFLILPTLGNGVPQSVLWLHYRPDDRRTVVRLLAQARNSFFFSKDLGSTQP